MNEWKTSAGRIGSGIQQSSSREKQLGEWLRTSYFVNRTFQITFFCSFLPWFCKELPPVEIRDIGQLLM